MTTGLLFAQPEDNGWKGRAHFRGELEVELTGVTRLESWSPSDPPEPDAAESLALVLLLLVHWVHLLVGFSDGHRIKKYLKVPGLLLRDTSTEQK